MSLPLLLSLADELDNLNTDYGFGYYHPHAHHQRRQYGRPLLRLLLPETESRHQAVEQRGKRPQGPVSNIGKDGFQVCMDVQQFKPSELVVKTVDNCVVVEGKHEEREDEHGFITRHFVRRYTLPKGYDPNQVVSTLSSDGVLTVKVPPPAKSVESNERIVQIQQTGPAHLSVKDNPKEDDDKSKDKEAEKK